MKRSLKKLPALLALLGVLVLAGCSAKVAVPNEADYQMRSDQYVQMLVSMDAATLETEIDSLESHYEDFEQQVALYPYIGGTGQKFDFTAEAYLSMLSSYAANLDEFGAYVGVKEYEGATEDSDGYLTYATVYEFEKHDMRMSLQYDQDNVVITATLDPIYSTGEIAQKAALNTLIGMGSVFVVLIILCFLISCFKYVHMAEEKAKKGKKTEEQPKKAAPAAPAPAPAAAPVGAEPELVAAITAATVTADTQLVAVITAAVAAESGMSADGFVVRSIRRRSGNKWKKS